MAKLTPRNQMSHPIHLHGHKFWVLGSGPAGSLPYPYNTTNSNNTFTTTNARASSALVGGGNAAINMANPPYRDTVEIPVGDWLVIRFVNTSSLYFLLRPFIFSFLYAFP